jgi:isopenicillin N synthase-like dioxygenase
MTMATKKVKKGAKTKSVKTKSKRVAATNGEAKPRNSMANFVRDQLERKVEPAKIVEKAKEAYPKSKPTVAYVNWIKAKSPKITTTTNAAAAM